MLTSPIHCNHKYTGYLLGAMNLVEWNGHFSTSAILYNIKRVAIITQEFLHKFNFRIYFCTDPTTERTGHIGTLSFVLMGFGQTIKQILIIYICTLIHLGSLTAEYLLNNCQCAVS